MSGWNLPFKMLWKKIKANIHMPCSVQSPPPPKLCFLFCLQPVPPWVSLLCAWGKVTHLPLSWCKPVPLSTFNISFLLFAWHAFRFLFWARSLRLEHKCASVIVLGRAVLRLSSSAPRLAASPCYSKGCCRGEAQVCVSVCMCVCCV